MCRYIHMYVHVGISAEPLGHGNKVEVTKLPRYKKEQRLVIFYKYVYSCRADILYIRVELLPKLYVYPTCIYVVLMVLHHSK